MGRRNLPEHAPLKTVQTPGPGKLWPVWGVLVACVWIAFAPALRNGFVDWDDRDWIVENESFRGLGWDQIRFAFTTFKGGVYQPLGWLLQSVDYEVFGLDPQGFHGVSLGFHVVNVLLLHQLCVAIISRSLPALAQRLGGLLGWLCALPVALHAVHPLRVELVAWASPQAYLPSVTFALLAMLAYLRAHPPSGGFRRSWMRGSSVPIVLAVLTKGSAVVLPFVFLILDAYPLGRLGPGRPSWLAVRNALGEKAAILVFCLGFTALAFVAKQFWGVDPEVITEPLLLGRVAQASFGFWFYLMKTVWPFGITAFYPRPESEDFITPLFAACFAGVAFAGSAAVWLRRRCPWLLAALAAYLVIISPYLGIVRVSVSLVSDRYSYAPMMAWVVVGCAGLCKLTQRRWPRPVLLGAGAGALAITGGLMALCSAQCRVWESNEHLWSQALEHAAWSAQVHDFMGATLAKEGKFDRAIAEFREALRIRPHYFEATCDLGAALDYHGETDAAVPYLREARRLRPKDAKAYLNLGAALVHQRHVDEAIALYREALRLQPNFANLHFNMGIALLHQRRVDPAIDELTRAVELRPSYTEAHNILGGAYALQGRLDEAIAEYKTAIRLEPNNAASRVDLGLALARQGHSSHAIAQLREAILRNRENPEAHQVLGAILISLGRITEAAAEFEEVLRLRPDHAQARALLAMARGRRG
jgi:Flp pilus assembly protein TadD